jgi:peptidoglycan/xylan/chitin deacetylase (PgdA/CDA1 family)
MRGGAWVAGAGAAAWAAYAWGAQCALPAIAWRRGRPGRRQVALTFDDGPDPAATPRLLRLLDERDVRATFFLIGERAARHPELVRAIAAGGHEVGNHTWRHRNAWLLPPGAAAREITEGARILGEILGSPPHLYRCSGPSSMKGSGPGHPPTSSGTSRIAFTKARSWTFTTRPGSRERPIGYWPCCRGCWTYFGPRTTRQCRWASSFRSDRDHRRPPDSAENSWAGPCSSRRLTPSGSLVPTVRA